MLINEVNLIFFPRWVYDTGDILVNFGTHSFYMHVVKHTCSLTVLCLCHSGSVHV